MELKGKKIVVTGPTGQVAKPVSLALAKDNEVTAIARFKNKAARADLEAGGVRCISVDLALGDFAAVSPDVDYVINNIRKVGVDPKSIKYIILSHGHLDHFGGAAKIQEASGARVVAVEEDWKMIDEVGSRPGQRGGPPPRVPKRDMVVKEGDALTLGGQALKFHQTPGHTPGVLTTEGITVYDSGKPYKAILWGGGGYRGGVAEAEQSVKSTDKVAQIKGVQVNLQIHSWAEDSGYPGGGVLERGIMLKSRKPGAPHPFVDPATFTQWVKRAQENAAKAVQEEKQKAGR